MGCPGVGATVSGWGAPGSSKEDLGLRAGGGVSRGGVRVSGQSRELWGSQGKSRSFGVSGPGRRGWVSRLKSGSQVREGGAGVPRGGVEILGPGRGPWSSQEWGTRVPRGGAGIRDPERPPSHQGRFLALHARPLREPRSTPRDRKWPPVGAGGAGPGGGTSGAHAPPPRSSGAVTLCSAGRAGPARPRRPAAAQPARRARAVSGRQVRVARRGARGRVGPPLHAGAGGPGAGGARPGPGGAGAARWPGIRGAAPTAEAGRGPPPPAPDRAKGAGSDPPGRAEAGGAEQAGWGGHARVLGRCPPPARP